MNLFPNLALLKDASENLSLPSEENTLAADQNNKLTTKKGKKKILLSEKEEESLKESDPSDADT